MYEKLLERRSVRKYKPEQITEELLDAVLEAGLYAPTAKNNQKPVMVAVRDKETRDLLSKIHGCGHRSFLWCTLCYRGAGGPGYAYLDR